MPVTIIAEAGVNHNGSLEMAKEMAHVAKECGADIVKYQTAVPELVVSKFAEKAEYQKQTTDAAEITNSTSVMLTTVAGNKNAIGYVSLDVVDGTVAAIALNGVAPTEENIVAGSYKLSRPFVMATKGTIEEQNEAVKTWFQYIASDEGKAVIQGLGLILPQ